MKTVVQVFEPGQTETMAPRERTRAVEQAIAHHALQLEELAGLLKELCSQNQDGQRELVDSDLYMPSLRVWIKERYEILEELENEYNRVDLEDLRQPIGP